MMLSRRGGLLLRRFVARFIHTVENSGSANSTFIGVEDVVVIVLFTYGIEVGNKYDAVCLVVHLNHRGQDAQPCAMQADGLFASVFGVLRVQHCEQIE